MPLRASNVFGIGLLIAQLVVMPCGAASAQAADQRMSPATEKAEQSALRNLGDLIFKASELTLRHLDLNRKLNVRVDISAVEQRLSEIATELEETAAQLTRLKASTDNVHIQAVKLNRTLKLQRLELEKAAEPVTNAAREMLNLYNEWIREKRLWQAAVADATAEEQTDNITSTLADGRESIQKALKRIRQSVEPLLAVQGKAVRLRVRILNLTAESARLFQAAVADDRADTYPPLVSSAFRKQLKASRHPHVIQEILRVNPGDKRYFIEQSRLIVFQIALALVLILGIHRNRKTVERTQRLQFMANRPVAAGLFLAIEPFWPFHTLGPAWWQALLGAVVGICLLRLSGRLFETRWKRQALVFLVFILVTNKLVVTVGSPIAIVRVYVFFTSAVGIFLSLSWAAAARDRADGIVVTAGLRLGAVFLAVALAAELLGEVGPARFVFVPMLSAIGLTIAWWLLMRSARGGMEWIVRRSNWPLPNIVRKNPDAAVLRSTLAVNAILGIVYLLRLLMIWDIYPDTVSAFRGMLAIGFAVGDQRITVELVSKAAVLAIGVFLSGWLIQQVFLKGVYDRRQLDTGTRFAINRLITYAFVFAGLLLAMAELGFELTQLTIILSALGVGIGFGLKEIVSNFVSGLILLLERPIRVGDSIELEGRWATIKKIGPRSTRIRTFDNADIIVPNNDLIINRVTNWTLSSRMMRLRIPVGVAYGSDIPLVMKTLKECATDHAGVPARPEPEVLFLRFGDSTLDFELRVWISSFTDRFTIPSQLHQQIDQRFRKAGITIAFPQRDLHLRSVDPSIQNQFTKPNA